VPNREALKMNRRSQVHGEAQRNKPVGVISKTLENSARMEQFNNNHAASVLERNPQLDDAINSVNRGSMPMYSLTNRNKTSEGDNTRNKYGLSNQKKKALIKPRHETVDDLPSELSEDEWGEINRYGQVLHEE